MRKNLVIGILLVAVIFLSAKIIRIENQRYALVWALCRKGPLPTMDDFECLETVQSRTSPWAHLWYALTD